MDNISMFISVLDKTMDILQVIFSIGFSFFISWGLLIFIDVKNYKEMLSIIIGLHYLLIILFLIHANQVMALFISMPVICLLVSYAITKKLCK